MHLTENGPFLWAGGDISGQRLLSRWLSWTLAFSRESLPRGQDDRQRLFNRQLCSGGKWQRLLHKVDLQRPWCQDLILAITSRRVHSRTTMVAGVACRIGDDLHICHISLKEDRCDFDEAMSIDGGICMVQARPDSSAGDCRHTEQENETIYAVIATAYM
jgi:hypothetical protein